jgi:outer membrane protein TolC
MFAGGVAGCANPFATSEEEMGMRVDTDRLRVIESARSLAGAVTVLERAEDREAGEEYQLPADPMEGLDEVTVSVEQCRAWTLENNLDLRVSLVEPVIAAENVGIEEAAFEATFFTNLRLSSFDQPTDSSLNGNQFEMIDATPGLRVPLRSGGQITLDFPMNRTETDNQFSTLDPSYTSDARFSISHNLLRGAGRRSNTHGVRIAALGSQISQARAKLEVIRRVAEVDRAYWRLYAVERVLDVREEQYALAVAQKERAERRVRAQVAAEIEVVRAMEGVAQRVEGIILARNLVSQAMRNLKRIVHVEGLEQESAVMLELSSEPDPVLYEIDRGAVIGSALHNRMEMLELELQVAQDISTIEFQKNQALPLFAVDYMYNYNGLGGSAQDSLTMLRGTDFADWSLALRFETPLGNEAAEGRVHQAVLRRLQRLATRELRTAAIKQEVLNAIDKLEQDWQRILAARQSVVLATRTVSAEESRFNNGLSTSNDVLDAATRLADAQQSEIAALVDYQITQVDLAFATGTLLGASRIEWNENDPRDADDVFGDQGWKGYLTPAADPGGVTRSED